MKKHKREKKFRIFNNSTFSALIGVVLGGLITGYFSFKTQKISNENQNKVFFKQHLVKRNEQLNMFLKDFFDTFYTFNTLENHDAVGINLLLNKMKNISINISLLNNSKIGLLCSDFTDELEIFSNNNSPDKSKIDYAKSKLISEILYQKAKIDQVIFKQTSEK